ncbi:HAMP domain-containing histidine kinase [Candidatus Saccharibacteria bacterium]|nr:HAMP domain-containing histidine kinase [Candidatus Saccharibacteria bacterium]
MEEVWPGLRAEDLVIVAHELKSPLATIRQLALLSEEGVPDLWPAALHESDRALKLVNDLTLLARLRPDRDGAGQTTLPLSPLNPRALCEEVAHELKPQFYASCRNLCTHFNPRVGLVWGEPRLFRSVVANLCQNALHYSDASHPSQLFIRPKGDRVLVGVRDYGPRLPAPVWRAINAGSSSPTAISRRPGSSGLGIFVAAQFARAMGASLGARQHSDGVSLWIDLAGSKQGSLW